MVISQTRITPTEVPVEAVFSPRKKKKINSREREFSQVTSESETLLLALPLETHGTLWHPPLFASLCVFPLPTLELLFWESTLTASAYRNSGVINGYRRMRMPEQSVSLLTLYYR